MKSLPEFSGKSVTVIDDDKENLTSIGRALTNLGFEVRLFNSPLEFISRIDDSGGDIIITDMKMPGLDGMEVIRKVKEAHPHAPVIVLTAFGTIGNAVHAIKEGATDYLQKPIDMEELKGVLIKTIRARGMMEELGTLRRLVKTEVGEILYRSREMEKVMQMVRMVAPTKANVLILGESGTGKELVARAIHEMSPRKDKLFMPINCAALTESILESELFGHEKGAFTGAVGAVKGKFEIASDGTLFLDEIGDLTLSTQAKLLRAIEQKEILRVGGGKVINVDVRIVAATNSDLRGLVSSKKFREDLFFRLSVFTIHIPPLRERTEDIPTLAIHFTKNLCRENGLEEKRISADAMRVFQQYPWPGNVRELRNVIESMVLLTEGEVISKEVLPTELKRKRYREGRDPIPVAGRVESPAEDDGGAVVIPLDEVEKNAIIEALKATGNNKTKAAKMLGIGVRTLYRKIKEYGLP
ncbi:MAG: response regulator [Deltaproteobacteria bacterium]|nr:response regulator [Deltaproteobacteria bacterium]NIS77477.1 response regulator [Deltaproteobacteria bacterium]